jgi:hypothetical protein
MASARIAAHPLVVAMAFGLIGPAAIAAEDESEASTITADDDAFFSVVDEPSAIDPDDFARVEREWLAVRNLQF